MSRSTSELVDELAKLGFVVLRGAIDPAACASYLRDTVMPAVHALSPYREDDPRSWLSNDSRMIAPSGGDMVRDPSGPDVHHMDPIKEGGRWPALFECETLNNFLDAWHGGGAAPPPSSSKSWKWLHDDNVGWIHIRFPQQQGSWQEVPKAGWHVDGAHFDPHRLDSPDQSVICLPILRDINKLGGGTSILKYSHLEVADFLSRQGRWGSSKRRLDEFVAYLVAKEKVRHERNRGNSSFVQCTASAGDILVLHPFVAHAASICEEPNPWRVTFNMGTKWTARSSDVSRYSPTLRDDAAAGRLHYDEKIYAKFTFDLSKSLCLGPSSSGSAAPAVTCDAAVAAWKDEERFEFSLVPFIRDRTLVSGVSTGDEVKLRDKVLIRFRKEGMFLSVDEGGRATAVPGPLGNEVTEAFWEKCVFEVHPFYGESGQGHVPVNTSSVYLFLCFAQKYLNIDGRSAHETTSCGVESRWNDRGEWQELVFVR